ncbi:MAG: hypothetical protein PHY22_00470 [Acholeplasmataceae bacterium]|nr:hypothetical protein [Acholeplasmataceae bacterium]
MKKFVLAVILTFFTISLNACYNPSLPPAFINNLTKYTITTKKGTKTSRL